MTTNENVDPERGGATRTGEPREALPKEQQPSLERGLGLKEAVALNMIEIVGIGPFVVSSLVIRAIGGPPALIAGPAGGPLFPTADFSLCPTSRPPPLAAAAAESPRPPIATPPPAPPQT